MPCRLVDNCPTSPDGKHCYHYPEHATYTWPNPQPKCCWCGLSRHTLNWQQTWVQPVPVTSDSTTLG